MDLMFLACLTGESPRGGARRVREKTKLLYQPKPDPEIYIVPISSILGRLPLVLAGDHGTIPADMRNSKCQLFKYGECYRTGAQGVAASFTTSTSGPCAGPLTIRRGP